MALIELVCRAHRGADGPGPLIALVDQRWAYCEGNGQSGHEWTPIKPTPREDLEESTQVRESRAS